MLIEALQIYEINAWLWSKYGFTLHYAKKNQGTSITDDVISIARKHHEH